MELDFTKMQGLGNDFIVINCLEQPFSLVTGQIRQLADRHFGIGFDQLLVISPATDPQADIAYRIYNSDGGEAAQCGNGARCIATYLRDKNILHQDEIVAETREGLLRLYNLDDGQVRVAMGSPRLQPADIPLAVEAQQPCYSLNINGRDVVFSALSLGNPHAVLTVDDVDAAAVSELGQAVQQSGRFPEGVNVGFMQVLDTSHIRLRVYERGAGETLACGSGACAAVVAGILAGNLENNVDVSLQGGNLLVSWQGNSEPVWLTGPAEAVYEGRVTL